MDTRQTTLHWPPLGHCKRNTGKVMASLSIGTVTSLGVKYVHLLLMSPVHRLCGHALKRCRAYSRLVLVKLLYNNLIQWHHFTSIICECPPPCPLSSKMVLLYTLPRGKTLRHRTHSVVDCHVHHQLCLCGSQHPAGLLLPEGEP